MDRVNILDAVDIMNNRVKPFAGTKRYLATGDLSGDQINEGIVEVDYDNKPSRADLLVEKGNILVARMQATNKVLLIDENSEDLIVSTGFLTLSPKDVFNERYLAHYFRSSMFQRDKDKFCSGATQKAINNGSFEKLKVPKYSLGEQKSISNRLDHADSLRQKRKEQLILLDDYLKSVFLEMFGDPVTNEKNWLLSVGQDYSDLITVGVVVRPASYYVDKGVIALRSLNIKPNRIDLQNIVYFSEESSKGVLAKSILKQGDVVVVRTGLTGTAAVVSQELDGSNCIDLIIVRPKKDKLNPFYLTFLLNSDIGKKLISSKEVGGIQKHFNVGAIKNIQIPLPPIDMQNKFASIVKQVEQTKQKMRESLNEMDNHFNALMQRCFG